SLSPLGHPAPMSNVDASPRLIWIAQSPQDMAAVEQAGQFWMRDIREALTQRRIAVGQRPLQMVVRCGESAERKQREAHGHMGLHAEGRVLVRLGQGEEPLGQNMRSLVLPTRLIKMP